MPISEATGTPFTLDGTERFPSVKIVRTHVLRASAALTTSYVQSNYAKIANARRVVLRFTHTWADSTSVEYYVVWSWDGTTWFRSVNWATSGGVNTGTLNNQTIAPGASANWTDQFDTEGAYISVYAKKTGGTGADALAISVDAIGD